MLRIESLVSELAGFAGEPTHRGAGADRDNAEAAEAKPPFLSLYLWTDPSRGPGRNIRAQLLQLIRPIRERVPAGSQAHGLDEAIAAAADYVRTLRSPPRGLAIFCSPDRDRFDAIRLRVPLLPYAEWSAVPYLRPLLAAIDEYERTLIVLMDKERARFIFDYLEQGEELATLTDEIPGRHAQGGYSQNKYQRDHDKHVLWHAKRIVETLGRLPRTMHLDRVLMSGPPEITAEVKHLLPARLRRIVSCDLGVPVEAPLSEALLAARRRAEQIEREGEVELVASLIEQTGRGRAVTGIEGAVAAVNRGAVALLAYDQALQAVAGRCDACGAVLAPLVPERCPFCQGEVARHDLVDLLAARTLAEGGRVEEVRGAAAVDLRGREGLAVLLRYRVEPGRSPTAGSADGHSTERGGIHAGT